MIVKQTFILRSRGRATSTHLNEGRFHQVSIACVCECGKRSSIGAQDYALLQDACACVCVLEPLDPLSEKLLRIVVYRLQVFYYRTIEDIVLKQ